MNWKAIRALPKPIVGKYEWWDFFDNDLFMAPSEQPRFWQVLQAAHEAQELLPKFNRAVELLRQVGNSRDELWESGHDEIFENIEAFLRALGGE